MFHEARLLSPASQNTVNCANTPLSHPVYVNHLYWDICDTKCWAVKRAFVCYSYCVGDMVGIFLELYFPWQQKFICAHYCFNRSSSILIEWVSAILDLYCYHDFVHCRPLFVNCTLPMFLVMQRLPILSMQIIRFFFFLQNLYSVVALFLLPSVGICSTTFCKLPVCTETFVVCYLPRIQQHTSELLL